MQFYAVVQDLIGYIILQNWVAGHPNFNPMKKAWELDLEIADRSLTTQNIGQGQRGNQLWLSYYVNIWF